MSFANLERFRVLAGLPPLTADQRQNLNEAWEDDDDNWDDDDLSPAEKELTRKSDRDLRDKDIDIEKDLKAARAKDKKAAEDKKAADSKAGKAGSEDHRGKDDDKDSDKKAADNRRETAKKDEKEDAAKRGGATQDKHDAEKKRDEAGKESRKADDEQDRKKYEDDKDEDENKDSKRGASVFGSMVDQNKDSLEDKPHQAAKKRGRTETERTGQFKSWVQSNPGATRAQAIAKAAELGINARHANTKFYQFRKAVKEFWILVNPENAQVLAESSTGRAPIWVVYESIEDLDAMIYETVEDATSAAGKLNMFGHSVVLMHIEDEE